MRVQIVARKGYIEIVVDGKVVKLDCDMQSLINIAFNSAFIQKEREVYNKEWRPKIYRCSSCYKDFSAYVWDEKVCPNCKSSKILVWV